MDGEGSKRGTRVPFEFRLKCARTAVEGMDGSSSKNVAGKNAADWPDCRRSVSKETIVRVLDQDKIEALDLEER